MAKKEGNKLSQNHREKRKRKCREEEETELNIQPKPSGWKREREEEAECPSRYLTCDIEVFSKDAWKWSLVTSEPLWE